MEKIEITLAFDGEKLDALEYALRKERTTVQKQMDEALRQLYEAKVPEAGMMGFFSATPARVTVRSTIRFPPCTGWGHPCIPAWSRLRWALYSPCMRQSHSPSGPQS